MKQSLLWYYTASISSGADPWLSMQLIEILGILSCNIMYLLFVDYNYLFCTSKRFADHTFGNLKLHIIY